MYFLNVILKVGPKNFHCVGKREISKAKFTSKGTTFYSHVRKMVKVLISILVEKLSRQKRLECLKSREKLFSHKKKKSLTLSF